MPKIAPPLTDIQCKNAKPSQKSYKKSDGGGLYLWVTPAGNKIWRMKYRFPKGGKEKLIVFGEYPAISLEDARQKRTDTRKLLTENIDPMAIKKEQMKTVRAEQDNTFEIVARQWCQHSQPRWSERNGGYVIRRLEQNIFPYIGSIPITQLKRKQILEALRHTEKRGRNNLAHRLSNYCKRVCIYAIHEELIATNPATELSEALEQYKKNHHAGLETRDIPAFIDTLERNEARLHHTTRLAIKLLMLTFVRTNELIGARWKEIDFDNSQWIIPKERMKMGQAHIVPLSKQTTAIFKRLYELNGHFELVFPNYRNPRKHMSNNTILRGIYQLGYKGKTTGHGFRATAMSTIQEKLGYRYEIVDRQLAHAPKDKMQAAYDRAHFLDDRTIMMQEWADYLDECAVSGRNVVQVRFGSG